MLVVSYYLDKETTHMAARKKKTKKKTKKKFKKKAPKPITNADLKRAREDGNDEGYQDGHDKGLNAGRNIGWRIAKMHTFVEQAKDAIKRKVPLVINPDMAWVILGVVEDELPDALALPARPQ